MHPSNLANDVIAVSYAETTAEAKKRAQARWGRAKKKMLLSVGLKIKQRAKDNARNILATKDAARAKRGFANRANVSGRKTNKAVGANLLGLFAGKTGTAHGKGGGGGGGSSGSGTGGVFVQNPFRVEAKRSVLIALRDLAALLLELSVSASGEDLMLGGDGDGGAASTGFTSSRSRVHRQPGAATSASRRYRAAQDPEAGVPLLDLATLTNLGRSPSIGHIGLALRRCFEELNRLGEGPGGDGRSKLQYREDRLRLDIVAERMLALLTSTVQV